MGLNETQELALMKIGIESFATLTECLIAAKYAYSHLSLICALQEIAEKRKIVKTISKK